MGYKSRHGELSGVMRSHDESKGTKMRQKGQEESRMVQEELMGVKRSQKELR